MRSIDTIVLFGATGELARKMLFPALYRLEERRILDQRIVGVALDAWSRGQFVGRVGASVHAAVDTVDTTVIERLSAGPRTSPATMGSEQPSNVSPLRSGRSHAVCTTWPYPQRCSRRSCRASGPSTPSLARTIPEPNRLVFRIGPSDGVDFLVQTKIPGERFGLATTPLSVEYEQTFGRIPLAYEHLLKDAIPARRRIYATTARSDGREDGVEAFHRILVADHEAVPAFKAPDTATHATVD